MNWITESAKRSIKMRNHFKMHEVDIYIKDPLPKNINADLVFSTIKRLIPSYFFRGIDIVYVGQFDVFREKEVNAVYQDGAIYVSNEQTNDEDMIDDIVHEISHSVEETYRDFIYDDNLLKNEFLGKRVRLYNLLDAYNYNPMPSIKTNYHYDKGIDMFLYKEIGYDVMWNFVNGLFPSPYSATSLREYFAVGFEDYFMKEKEQLKKICPILFAKLEKLEYMED